MAPSWWCGLRLASESGWSEGSDVQGRCRRRLLIRAGSHPYEPDRDTAYEENSADAHQQQPTPGAQKQQDRNRLVVGLWKNSETDNKENLAERPANHAGEDADGRLFELLLLATCPLGRLEWLGHDLFSHGFWPVELLK